MLIFQGSELIFYVRSLSYLLFITYSWRNQTTLPSYPKKAEKEGKVCFRNG